MTASQHHSAAVRDRLLEFAKSIPPDELMPTLASGAAELVAENPFAFILAVALDRGTRAEIIWTIPYWIREELGHLDPARLAQMTSEQILEVLSRIPRKPRYMRDAPQTILEVARLVSNQFAGNADLIWRDRTAQEVKRDLRSIHGVGEGIASMAVILLQRCRNVRFPDWSNMDVKPDVHVQRVLYRLAVAPGMSEGEALRAAANLNPEYPGALDPSLWVIGRRWCKDNAPFCSDCIMNDLCPKVGL